MTDKPEHIARLLLTERRQALPYHALQGIDRPEGLEEAYKAQEALCRLLHNDGAGDIAGYKIALTSEAMQRMVGVDQPLSGAIFGSRLMTAPIELRPSDFQHLGVECELAVRLAAPLPAGRGLHDRDSAGAAVGAIMPAFELVDDRHADYAQIDAESLVADNAWNAGAVLGPELADWRKFDFVESRGLLEINGQAHSEGKAGDALGHPLDALAWLANALNRQGKALEAGMIVMTGSVVRTVFPEPGDSLRFTLDGCGEARVSLSAEPFSVN